jgi:hypothetical protein
MGRGLKAKKSAGSLTPLGFCHAEKWERQKKSLQNPFRICQNPKKLAKTPDFRQV